MLYMAAILGHHKMSHDCASGNFQNGLPASTVPHPPSQCCRAHRWSQLGHAEARASQLLTPLCLPPPLKVTLRPHHVSPSQCSLNSICIYSPGQHQTQGLSLSVVGGWEGSCRSLPAWTPALQGFHVEWKQGLETGRCWRKPLSQRGSLPSLAKDNT